MTTEGTEKTLFLSKNTRDCLKTFLAESSPDNLKALLQAVYRDGFESGTGTALDQLLAASSETVH